MPYHTRKHFDSLSIFFYLLLVGFGWLNIYAACLTEAHSAVFDFSVQHGKQLIWIGVAFIVAVAFLFIRPRIFANFTYIIYAICMLLLIVTLFIGSTTNGGHSWIDFGIFKLQASEFAKYGTALAVSKYISGIDIDLRQRKPWMVMGGLIAGPAAVIVLQHDVGSALVFASFLIPFYRYGMTPKIFYVLISVVSLFFLAIILKGKLWILVAIILAVALLYLFGWLNKRTVRDYIRTFAIFGICTLFVFSVKPILNSVDEHQANRIKVLIDPSIKPDGIGYNVRQSKIAIGSGGFFGKGWKNGTITKADFVPEQETDFIFCTVGEEWGFVGCGGLLLIYTLLLIRIVNLAERQRSSFSRFYGYSVASIFFFHLVVNVGMVLGLVPVIGIPLPFFSYGGSSMIAFTALLFTFLSLDSERTNSI